MTHHRHHKCDLKLHYHPLIYGTVCCAAGMLMCQHSSSGNVILKMQDLVIYIYIKLNLLPTKKKTSQAHNMCQQCFMFITLSPVSQISHHAPPINTHILHTWNHVCSKKVRTETYKLLVHATKPKMQTYASPCQQTSCFILFDTSMAQAQVTSRPLPSDTVVWRS